MEISNTDFCVLKKFFNGNIITSQKEENILDEYRKIGLVRIGAIFNKSPEGVKVIPTASLTLLGKSIIEEKSRSGWKKFIDSLIW